MRGIWNSIADYIRECDKVLLLLCLAASGFGCIAVLTSTRFTGSPRQFITQCVGVLLGVFVAVVISKFDYNHYKKLWPIIALACLIPVILTFFPRWMR